MGTYCTTTSLENLAVGTTFDAKSQALAQECIDEAESTINQHLSKRYDLSGSTFQTATSVPPKIRSICRKLSMGLFYQYGSRGRGPKDVSMSRGMKLESSAVKELEAIRDYQTDLCNTAGSIISDKTNTAYQVLSNTDDYQTTFNEDDPLDWKVDADKLEDIESDRG